MNTTTDLVRELHSRNMKGRLANTIRAAQEGYFHSYKSPSMNPRHELIWMLSIYPETYDLADMARSGKIEDPPDRGDCVRFRESLLKDYPEGHDIFVHFGLTEEILNLRFPNEKN